MHEGDYPQDNLKAYPQDKKNKMVFMSTGYRYPIPLSARNVWLLFGGATSMPAYT